MSLVLICIGLILFLFWAAKLRGVMLGLVLGFFGISVMFLSRFHIRKNIAVLASLLLTFICIRLCIDLMKARKK